MIEQKIKKEDISPVALARTVTDFIKINDKHYTNANLDHLSLTTLVMIKTSIEIKLAHKKRDRH